MEDSGSKHLIASLFTLGCIYICTRLFLKRRKSALPKWQARNSEGKIDLDDELSRKTPRPPGLAVRKENWKVSSDKSRQEKLMWNEDKSILGLGAVGITGLWKYTSENERFWIDKANGTFVAYKGDQEISSIYRETWQGGDASTFIDTIYKEYAVDDVIPEVELWKIWRCLTGELVPMEEAWHGAPPYILANPDTIWQTGKCIFQILTRGRFFNNDLNILQLVDNGEKFGVFKVAVLHKTYSQNLLNFVLLCLAFDSHNRPTRETLMNHFEDVLAIFAHGPTSKPTKEPEPKHLLPEEEPYHPTNTIIPKGLTKAYGAVYETILQTVEKRVKKGENAPRLVVITDLAKDFDDLLAMIALKELYRLGAIRLEGFVANLSPEKVRARLGRGALDALGLLDVPMAAGSPGEHEPHNVLPYEFEGSETFIAPESTVLEDGQALLHRILTKAKNENYKITLLTISSLMDIAKFASDKENLALLTATLGNIVLQGGYSIIDGKLEADMASANNNFASEDAKTFHEFLQKKEIPSTCFTKVATFATPIYQAFLVEIEETGVNIGAYLRAVQLGQGLHYWKCASGPKQARFREFMDEDWFLNHKTTWYDKHEFDEPGPPGDEIIPWLDKVTAYDCLAAIGAAGEDLLNALGVIAPLTKRKDAEHPIHKIVGVLAIQDPNNKGKCLLPEEANIHGETFATAIKALVLGSLLSVVQKE